MENKYINHPYLMSACQKLSGLLLIAESIGESSNAIVSMIWGGGNSMRNVLLILNFQEKNLFLLVTWCKLADWKKTCTKQDCLWDGCSPSGHSCAQGAVRRAGPVETQVISFLWAWAVTRLASVEGKAMSLQVLPILSHAFLRF